MRGLSNRALEITILGKFILLIPTTSIRLHSSLRPPLREGLFINPRLKTLTLNSILIKAGSITLDKACWFISQMPETIILRRAKHTQESSSLGKTILKGKLIKDCLTLRMKRERKNGGSPKELANRRAGETGQLKDRARISTEVN